MPSGNGDKPKAKADLQVGRWCVQPSLNELRDGSTVRHVEPQVMDLLAFEKPADLGGRLPWLLGWLGLACGRAGQEDRAQALREELLAGSRTDYVSPFAIALISIGLDDADGAFEWMDRAIDQRDPFVIPVLSYPILDPLRADPRYLSLLEKMNLTASGPDRASSERPTEGAAALQRAER